MLQALYEVYVQKALDKMTVSSKKQRLPSDLPVSRLQWAGCHLWGLTSEPWFFPLRWAAVLLDKLLQLKQKPCGLGRKSVRLEKGFTQDVEALFKEERVYLMERNKVLGSSEVCHLSPRH